MTDAVIIREAVKLVDDGVSVTFPVKGRSMIPFIVGGRDSVILQKPGSLVPGLVVLAEISPDHFVLHRIIDISPDGMKITLMGDGNVRGTETCTPSTVLARATHVVDPEGRIIPLESEARLRRARLWRRLLPLRRYLLAIMRRTIKKYA
ncbi:MAG: hypothetical protein K6G53_09150 [Bacteroidales bacterium]|nr:hypothetical protein [Bacteroidales bacterium]